MVKQFSQEFLENIAVGMSTFVPSALPDLCERPNVAEQLFKLGMLETLFVKLKPVSRRTLRQLLRRLSAAERYYREMSSALGRYGMNFVSVSPKFADFFIALDAAEACILQIHVAIDCWRNSDSFPAFEGLGDSPERVNLLANSIKHAGAQAKARKQGSLPSFPVFFRDQGLTNANAFVAFSELHQLLRFMGEFVEALVAELVNINPLNSVMEFKHSP